MFPIMEEVMVLLQDKSTQKYNEYKSYIDVFNNEYKKSLTFYNEFLKQFRQKLQSQTLNTQDK